MKAHDGDDDKDYHDSATGFRGQNPNCNSRFAIKCQRGRGFYRHDWWIYGNDDFVITKPDRQETNKKLDFLTKQVFNIYFITFVGSYVQSTMDVFIAPSTKYTCAVMKWNSTTNKLRERSLRNHCRTQSFILSRLFLLFWLQAKYIWKKIVVDTLGRG